jgi:hypothetical protein
VDWSQLYDKDHYKIQEKIYEHFRPTLLSNTLVVPTQKIREHIQDLSSNDYNGLKKQVEVFHRTTKKTIDHQSSLIPIQALHHLQTYTIQVN